ncbi:branched-chain amino acid ABC transporter permease/ATP-binding protein [Nocardia aurea]|uniref:branched-chain amino acid ABC transporter permease/ATP-binding protein n=1 Tax=Nocardia aurea TaxID=2144174 RepID=UPI000D697405|nr:branched-chain amino acid ABC transporter permease/ATP-binding protein [Nocardia aurea]
MTTHLQFLLLGLGAGAVFAALALALVVIYRSSGVIHFATGSIALYTAYTYAFLRKGELLVLIPGLPKSIDLGDDPGFWASAAISLGIAAVLGAVLYLLVFRPLRTAPPVAKAVASIGLMVIFTELAVLRVGTAPIGVKPIFPTGRWSFGGVSIPKDRVWFALTIVVVAVALAAIYRFTRFGLATRAAAESEKGAYVSGLSPDRVAAWNWMIGTAVAGLSGILIAPIVPLAPTAYTLFIVPALAAAILGRFSSVVGAVLAGLMIGMLQSEAQYLAGVHGWLPSSGSAELVPLVLIVLFLVIRARELPARGAVILSSLGRAPRPDRILLCTAIPAVVAMISLAALNNEWRAGLITSLIFSVIALSLVVVTGYAGQVSLAQLALAGAAGFLLGPIADSWGVPFPFAPLVAAAAASALGVVVGLPALRVRGLTVAVVTLALAYAIEAVWFRNSDIVSSSGVRIPPARLFGYDLGIGSGTEYPRLAFGVLCLIVLIAVGVAVAILRRSRLGARMLAVRANERSAAASGINVVRTKLVAFAIGGFIAGIGGCLMAYQQTTVSFEPFAALAGLALFATVYLVGVTSVSGGLLAGLLGAGGIVFVALDKLVAGADWYQVAVGIGLVLTVLLNPEGLVGPGHRLAGRLRARNNPTPTITTTYIPDNAALEPEPIEISEQDALTLHEVTVRYGGVVAVDLVDLSVPRGAIVGLIGPNGAGKTSLIDAISGFAPANGRITLGDNRIDELRSFERIRAGLGRTFQAVELYDDLSVSENVLVGRTSRGRKTERDHSELDELFELLDLTEVRDVPVGELSHGMRQLVSIARALAGRPRVLLLDEPAGGLDTNESRWLADRLRAIRASGVSILLVEHDMGLVLSLCDRIHVLDFGRTLATGTPSQIRNDRAVAEAYLGSAHAEEVTV